MDIESLFHESPNHRALFEQIKSLCLSFPGTSERMSHGGPTFFIDDKSSFVQYRVNHHGDGRIALWCSAPSGVQSTLVESDAEIYFIPPYVGHRGWIGMRLDRHAEWEEIANVIGDAYLSKAPKKYRALLN